MAEQGVCKADGTDPLDKLESTKGNAKDGSTSNSSVPLVERRLVLDNTEDETTSDTLIDNYQQDIDISLDEQEGQFESTTSEETFIETKTNGEIHTDKPLSKRETGLEVASIENTELYNAVKEYKEAINDCIKTLKKGHQKETVSSSNTTSFCDEGPNLALDESKGEESCLRLLQMTVDKQSELIKELYRILCTLTESGMSNSNGSVWSLEQKMGTLLEQVGQLCNERFCEGRCAKHGKTSKCFCRGFSQPHRCCGRLGNVCEC